MDARHFGGLFPPLGDDRRDVGNLVAGGFENLFAHQLGDDGALWLVGQFVFGIKRRPFGQVGERLLDQQLEAVAGERRERDHFGKLALVGISADARQQARFIAERVHFVEDQERRRLDRLQHVENETVACAHRLRGVHD